MELVFLGIFRRVLGELMSLDDRSKLLCIISKGILGIFGFFLGILIELVIVYIKGISLGIFDADSGVSFFRNFDRFLVIARYKE